jgi:Domain of unknown function (DUF4168)
LAAALGVAGGWMQSNVWAQEKAGTQKNLTDQELRNFAKAYVGYHKIKQDYENRINRTQDPKERQRLQAEGDTKVSQVLQKQGFTNESYTKTFAAVNTNEELRKKTLKYIEEERKRS